VKRQPPRGPPKPNRGQFKPGQSGNPGGAKKIPEDIKQAFREISPKAVQTLFAALSEAPWPIKVAAAREILDRHLGRPRQSVEMSGPNQGPIAQITSTMSQEEAAHMYALTLAASALPDETAPSENGHDASAEES
jgi:hypothetical protein